MTLPTLITEPYRLLSRVLAVLLVLLALYATGRHHGAEHVRGQWAQAKAEQLAAQAEAERTARLREQAMIDQLRKAQYEAAERETALRAAAAAAGAAAGSLRNDLAVARSRLSAATAEACRATASTALELLGTCADEYRAVAAAADGHAADVQALTEAWPQ